MSFGRLGALGRGFGRLGSVLGSSGGSPPVPSSWVPLADGTGNALVDLDFENSKFHFNGTTYDTFAAVLAAIGTGSNNGDGTYTLGPNSNIPFAGYNTSEGTIVCEYINSSLATSVFAWTIQQAAVATNYWRLLAQDAANKASNDTLSNSVGQAVLLDSAAAIGARIRSLAVMKVNDFGAYRNGGTVATDTSGSVPIGITSVAAQIGHRNGANKLVGTIYRWAYFPRAVVAEDRIGLSVRSTDVVIGGRTFFNSPGVVVVGGKTYAMQINASGTIGPRRQYGSAITLKTGMNVDDHDEGGMLRRSLDGRYIAHYCNHSTDNNFYQRISTNPDDISSWGVETNLGASIGATAYTYSNLVEVTDGIFDITRANSGVGYISFGYTQSTDNGATWSAFAQLFNEPNHRSYTRVCKRAANQFDLVCNDGHPDEFTVNQNSTYHLYYDAGTFRTSPGVSLGSPPFRPQSVLTKVWDAVAQGKSSWVWDVQPGPVCVFATFTPGAILTDHQYQYAKWNGSAWVVNQICTAGGTLYPVGDDTQPYYSGGICIDPDDANIVYCSRETGTGGPHRNGGWFQLWKCVTADGGATWTMTQLTTGSQDSFRPKKAPSSQLTYVKASPSHPYTSFSNFGCEIAFMTLP